MAFIHQLEEELKRKHERLDKLMKRVLSINSTTHSTEWYQAVSEQNLVSVDIMLLEREIGFVMDHNGSLGEWLPVRIEKGQI